MSSNKVAAIEQNAAALAEERERERAKMIARKRGRRVSVSAECGVMRQKFVPKVVAKTDEQVVRITDAVSKSFLFSALDKDQLKVVIDSMEEVKVASGESIIKEGDEGHCLYVIEAGEFNTFVKSVDDGKTNVCTYKKGGSFGELALMYNAPRAATVTAVMDSILWSVDRPTFQHIIQDSSSRRRKKYEGFLEQVPILRHLQMHQRAQVADVIQRLEFEDGAVVIKEGDDQYDAMRFYFVESGECKAISKNDGKDVVIGTMGVGDFFGEKALIEKKPRACDVVSSGKTVLAALDVAGFERIMGPCKAEMTEKIQRYKSAEEVIAEGAVAGAGDTEKGDGAEAAAVTTEAEGQVEAAKEE